MSKLNGKVAVVTGAGRGIGRGVALALAKEGATTVICARNAEEIAATGMEIKSLGGRTLALSCDVGQRQQVDAVVAATVKEFGTVDILVNNAQGARLGVAFEDTSDADIALALGSGLYGTYYFMQACFPYLKSQGGKIINFGSQSGLEGQAYNLAYAVTKEAIRTLTRVAAHEWGKYKINVNAICPFADSPGSQSAANVWPDAFQALVAQVPMGGRIGDCEKDIGPVVVFLASPDSDYVTGMTIMADGGLYVLR